MFEILLFLGALLGLIAFFRTSTLKKRVSELEQYVNQLLSQQSQPQQSQSQNVAKYRQSDENAETVVTQYTPQYTKYPKYQPTQPNQDVQQILADPNQPIPSLQSPIQDTQQSNQAWEVIDSEKFTGAMSWIKENWAGFLGVTILVLGITFAAAYVGYFATPFIRFLMVLSTGLLLLVAAILLRQKNLWQELSSWLQSASGAVVLLAMIGSQAFQTLQFYHDPLLGQILLSIGLFYNLLLAYFAPKQMQAALHVLISLSALYVVPKDLLALIVASIVTLSGIGLSIRNAWNMNLLLTYITFTAFHFNWFNAQADVHALALYGVIGISIVGASALLVHYRKIYQHINENHNLFAHVTIWLLLGSQYLLYNFGFKYLFIPLGVAAIVSMVSSLYAKKQNVDWLFQCDALMGQLLALSAIGSLTRIEFRRELIPWLATIESLAFATVAYCTQQKWLSKCGLALLYLSFVALSAHLLSMSLNHQEMLMITLGTLVPIYVVRWYLANRETQDNAIFESYDYIFPFMLDILLFGLGIVAITTPLLSTSIGYIAALAILFGFALNKVVIHHDGHKGLYLIYVAIIISVGWFKMTGAVTIAQALLGYFLPATLLLFGILWLKILSFNQEQEHFEDLWIYFLGFHFGIGAYLLLGPISEYLPGISYLILATVFFEYAVWMGNRLHSPSAVMLAAASKNMAMIYLLAYCVLYIALYMQSEVTILPILSMNELLGLVVIVICGYWYYTPPFTNQYSELANRNSVAVLPVTQAIPFDLAIVMALTLLMTSFSAPIHPMGYGLIALMLVIPYSQRFLPPRASIYAILLLFALCVQVAVVSSTWASPLSSNWYQTTHITGPLSLMLGMVVATCLLKKAPDTTENKWLKLYYLNPILIGYIPIFTSLAFFLTWRFDKAFLTMLWVIEIVAVVMLGYFLKSKALVQIALVFLLICVLRLVFYDLGQTDLLIRAVVFIIVGLLMIFIHMIYKKYADRLS